MGSCGSSPDYYSNRQYPTVYKENVMYPQQQMYRYGETYNNGPCYMQPNYMQPGYVQPNYYQPQVIVVEDYRRLQYNSQNRDADCAAGMCVGACCCLELECCLL